MWGMLRTGCLLLCLLALGCRGGGNHDDGGAGGVGGQGGVGGHGGSGGEIGAAGNGGTSGRGGIGGSVAGVCEPEATRDCYTGPPGTVNVGACVSGLETCNAEGTDWSPCMDQVVPSMEVPTPPDGTPVDEDCDGLTDEMS